MELLYKPQELKAGQLNYSFNEIVNTEIIKPTWKGNKTYGDTFFIKKRKSIKTSIKNIPDGDIVDTITIDDIEYLLMFNGYNLDVAYFDGTNYVGMNLGYTRTDNTPYKFITGKSGKGEIFEEITIEDAYIDLHDRGSWDIATDYIGDNIVQYSGTDYIAIQDGTGQQPDTETEYWVEYVSDESGYDQSDPATIVYRDVYKGSYLKLKLSRVNIRDLALIGRHILFDNNDSNLQGVATEIHYTETTYIDAVGTEIALPDDEIYVYIRGTNSYGTRPYIGEEVSITTEVGEIPIIAIDTKVIALHIKTLLGEVIGAKTVELYEASDGDEIVDLARYDGVSFILTKSKILFSRVLLSSTINFYPLDLFSNLIGYEKILPFGKTLVIFGINNGIISPIIGTEGTKGYTITDLQYNSNLYSKYSAIATMGSLYVLQDDKQFVQVDLSSDDNIDYQATITNAIPSVRGQFDFIVGDIFMNEWDRIVYVLDIGAHGTYYYKYDIEYKHWDTGDYLNSFYKIEDNLYGDGLFDFNDNYFDNTEDYRTQVVGFDFGGENLDTLKQVYLVKMIFGLNEKIIDYTLEVDYELGGILHNKIIDLNNYPINLEIGSGNAGLGDTNFGTTLIGEGQAIETTAIGNFISVTVGLGITASVFNFKIKSKENGFIYGGSIIGYTSKLPTVTEYNYKH